MGKLSVQCHTRNKQWTQDLNFENISLGCFSVVLSLILVCRRGVLFLHFCRSSSHWCPEVGEVKAIASGESSTGKRG